MDSSGSSISSLGAAEATQLLKDMLNVGKQRTMTTQSVTASETSTASLASSMKDDIENTSIGNGVQYSLGEVILRPKPSGTPDGILDNRLGQLTDQNHRHTQSVEARHMELAGLELSSGNEADRSQSLAGDDAGGGEDDRGDISKNLENGLSSLSEMLMAMGRKPTTGTTKQQILLQGDDRANSFSVYGRDVDIISSSASALESSSAGSNKVKINPVVNFDWEHKQYVGNLVAVHRNGIHVAYVLRGKSGGIVRVINRRTAERALLRGFSGRVIDVAFAHLSPIVLGTVDEIGNMFIYEILEGQEGKIDTSLLLQVNRPSETAPSSFHRIIWCPYIPDEEEASGTTANETSDSSLTEDIGKLLVLTHGEAAEMWNVDLVTREYGSGPLMPGLVDVGLLTINSHSKPILDASFSPDGTALATASADGEVKFFQVYMHDKAPPRCLHEWKPHDGRPVSSLFFLDDHKHPNPEVQFWKFAVTGSDNNSEIKIWSCESWICLQTIRILADPEIPPAIPSEPCLKAAMDLAANYLVLTDIRRKVLYVLQIHQDNDNSRAHVCSVSEFLLTHPCLSFAVLDASRRKFRHALDQTQDGVDDLTTGEVVAEYEEEVNKDMDGPNIGVLVRLYSVHTRALQELQIRFKAESSVPQLPAISQSSFSLDDSGLHDPLSDLSMETFTESEWSRTEVNQQVPPLALDHSRSSSERTTPRDQLTTPRAESDNISTVLTLSERSSASAAEHARAQAEAHLKDLIKGAYSGSIRRSASPRGPMDTGGDRHRPLLMTPEAFLSKTSPRVDNSQVLDSVRSSASSNFTQVTAMDEDQQRTPHMSVSHNLPSPGSSITLTPASSRDMSAVGSPHAQNTPTSLPLPPVTPGEDAALKTGATPDTISKLTQKHPIQELRSGSPSAPSTPPRGVPAGSSLPPPPTAASMEFFTSSPASHKPQHFRPPVRSDSERGETSSEALDEIFEARVVSHRQSAHSTGSSSSTSLEVLEILEGAKKPGQEDMFEEESDEGPTPTPKGLDVQKPELKEEEDEEPIPGLPKPQEVDLLGDVEPNYEQLLPRPVPASNRDVHNKNESSPIRAREHEVSSQDHTPPSKYDERIWPTPPDFEQVQVDLEAQRLASEAITRAATLQSGPESSSPDDDEDDVVIEEDLDETEGDVQIEEEKTEIIEEIVEEEGGGEITIHTHERPSAGVKRARRQRSLRIPSIEELTRSVQSMVGLLQSQQDEIEQLRSEIRSQRQTAHTVTSLQSHIADLESALTSRLTGALDQHSQSETQRLQKVLGERESQDQIKHEALVASLSQRLDVSLSAKLDSCVKEEVRRSVVPGVARILDPVKQQLHSDIAQKLTATDTLMKESINKLVRSRQTIEAIGTAAGNAIQGPIQTTCRDVLMPSFDRACQNMCHQVNQTFQRGTQDYAQQLEGHMEQVRRRHEEARDPIVQQLQAMVEATRRRDEAQAPVYAQVQKVGECLQACTTAVQDSHTQLDAKIQDSVTGLQEFLLGEVQRIIEDKVVSVLREQQASINDQLMSAMRSQAATPVVQGPPAPDPQQTQAHILQLLRQGQLNAAFQQALSASDLKLVMFVCETVDPTKVFSQKPFPLLQAVLLSLIQQLSADLTNSTELKHKYLEESVMNLEPTNAVTREHLPSVLGQLCQKLSAHIQANPHDNMTRPMRMLLMMTQSMIK